MMNRLLVMCSIKKIQITAKIDTAIFNRLNYIIEIIWIEISAIYKGKRFAALALSQTQKTCFWASNGNQTHNLLMMKRSIELVVFRWQSGGYNLYRFERFPSGAQKLFPSLRKSLSSKQFTFKLQSCKSFHNIFL